jgi:hypothetical protein
MSTEEYQEEEHTNRAKKEEAPRMKSLNNKECTEFKVQQLKMKNSNKIQ